MQNSIQTLGLFSHQFRWQFYYWRQTARQCYYWRHAEGRLYFPEFSESIDSQLHHSHTI